MVDKLCISHKHHSTAYIFCFFPSILLVLLSIGAKYRQTYFHIANIYPFESNPGACSSLLWFVCAQQTRGADQNHQFETISITSQTWSQYDSNLSVEWFDCCEKEIGS